MNKQIKNNDNLIILTHHPFYTPNTFKEGSRFLKKKDGEIQFWFSNKNAKIPGNKKIIFIHGHTHDDSYDEKHLTNAIGRKENSKELKLSFIDLQNF
jgi:calcineurin-like phosphoesterase family protein